MGVAKPPSTLCRANRACNGVVLLMVQPVASGLSAAAINPCTARDVELTLLVSAGKRSRHPCSAACAETHACWVRTGVIEWFAGCNERLHHHARAVHIGRVARHEGPAARGCLCGEQMAGGAAGIGAWLARRVRTA